MLHKRDILSAVTMVAGLSGLFCNNAFTALLDKALPATVAGPIVTWGSLAALTAGWVVGRLTPSPTQDEQAKQ